MSNPPIGIEAYPLRWPLNKPRTAPEKRERSNFGETSFAKIRDQLLNEIKLLRGKQAVISSNVNLRRDGLPLAGQAQPKDSGVAVYFLDRGGRQKCIACDRWHKVEHNLKAIAYTIDALRSVERWGTGDMVEAAFAGFTALPPGPVKRPWWDVFALAPSASTELVNEQRRILAKQCHPDLGGTHEKMAELNEAFEEFKRERGLT